MKFDVAGKAENTRSKLRATHCLLPLFEAIANSIHAIQDAKEKDGRIEIKIHRDRSQGVLRQDATSETFPVNALTITDNGIGLDTKQFDSFDTAESRTKVARGGKGIGRFTWLAAFRHADVDSVFVEKGKWFRRTFRFVPTGNGIEGMKLEQIEPTRLTTSIRLEGMLAKYKDVCPKQAAAIARRIIEHCLESFIYKKAPKMVLIDDDGTEIVLNDIYDRDFKKHEKQEDFQVNGKKFHIAHMLVPPPAKHEGSHRLHFCGDGRSVTPESLKTYMPELATQSSPIRDEEHRPLFYTGYVSGKFLDDHIADDRTGFTIFEDEEDVFEGAPWSMLVDKSVQKAKAYLAPHLEPVRVQKKQQIDTFVETVAPEYRPVVKHRPDLIEAIPANLPSDKLELRLHEANQAYERQLKEKYNELLLKKDADTLTAEQHREKLEQFIEEWNESGTAKLARYVAYRKATLAFLEDQLKLDDDQEYPLENAVHKIIFPLRATTEDVPFDKQNLWVIDEKLAFHHYLASDMPLKQNRAAPLNSKDRPDIIVFNRPIAVVDQKYPYPAITIFEFKRAGRDDYKPDDNPIDQVCDYVDKLRDKDAKDREGRPLNVQPNTRFYAYVVCDITTKLDQIARRRNLQQTPDGEGYFGYNTGIYIEVISFKKLVDDAWKRNAMLFHCLGINQDKKHLPIPGEPEPAGAEGMVSGNGDETQLRSTPTAKTGDRT